jgi:methylmalonyl-CoA/ethylmalonyl-CoA epimerase
MLKLARIYVNKVRLGSRLYSDQSTVRKWKVLKLNHVAIATPNVGKASKFYRDVLGSMVTQEGSLPEHGVNTLILDVGNNTKIELLDHIGMKNSPIASFVEKNKLGGIHHICLEVDDIKAAMEDIKGQGIRLLNEEPKIGAHGKPVCFIHPKDCSGVLVELEQF